MPNTMTSSPVIIEPRTPADKAVFWMHGLGADGNDFVPIIDELGLSAEHGIRFIFPQAPVIPVTINAGMQMRAWYDILSMDDMKREVDHQGIEANTQAVLAMMQQQHQLGIAWHNMVVAGFSQGGVIASALALSCQQPIAGLICLSTYFPFDDNKSRVEHIPAFVGHGRMDRVVPYQLGVQCQEQLSTAGFAVELYSYNMDHSVCSEEINHISQWLQKVL